MIITAAILAIFVYGMVAAMLGTILPALSEAFRHHARPERLHRPGAGPRVGHRIGVGGAADG